MKKSISVLLGIAGLAASTYASADIVLYGREGFGGRSFATDKQVWNLERFGFNDRASSAQVRGGRWEVCTDARFSGRCVMLRRGDYPDLRQLGLQGNISSVRPLSGRDRWRDGAYERHAENDRRY